LTEGIGEAQVVTITITSRSKGGHPARRPERTRYWGSLERQQVFSADCGREEQCGNGIGTDDLSLRGKIPQHGLPEVIISKAINAAHANTKAAPLTSMLSM